VNAVIAIATVCKFCSRFSAVTTISVTLVAPAGAAVAAAVAAWATLPQMPTALDAHESSKARLNMSPPLGFVLRFLYVTVFFCAARDSRPRWYVSCEHILHDRQLLFQRGRNRRLNANNNRTASVACQAESATFDACDNF
jgi:hypothetical protein